MSTTGSVGLQLCVTGKEDQNNWPATAPRVPAGRCCPTPTLISLSSYSGRGTTFGTRGITFGTPWLAWSRAWKLLRVFMAREPRPLLSDLLQALAASPGRAVRAAARPGLRPRNRENYYRASGECARVIVIATSYSLNSHDTTWRCD